MPSTRPQFNARMDPETAARLPRLLRAVAEATGLEVSQADLLRLAFAALERQYPPADAGEPFTRAHGGRPRKKGSQGEGR